MTPKVIAIAAFAAGLLVAGSAQGLRYGIKLADKDIAIAGLDAEISALKAVHAENLKQISDKAQAATAAALAKQQAAEQALADSDTKHIEALKNAKAENDRLAAAVDAGERRLRVQGRCPAPAGSNQGGQNAAAGSLGDDTTVELSGAAGRNVLGIRSGILDDRAKIAYLQDYARQCQALGQD